MASQFTFKEILKTIIETPVKKQQLFDTAPLPLDEQHLIDKIYTLLTSTQEIPKTTNTSTYIGFFGPLGVGKTTLASALTARLGAQFIVKEPYLVNPFWKFSQTDPSYMLRSQVYFLVSNIESDQQAVSFPGIAISDTSTITDIVMWAQWYYEIGHLTEDEFRLYNHLVQRLKPSIPRPSLLVTLLPDTVDTLYEGIRQRESAELSRKGELIFTKEDLQAQIDRVNHSSHKIHTEWETHVLTLTIDSQAIFSDKALQEHHIDHIIAELSS